MYRFHICFDHSFFVYYFISLWVAYIAETTIIKLIIEHPNGTVMIKKVNNVGKRKKQKQHLCCVRKRKRKKNTKEQSLAGKKSS